MSNWDSLSSHQKLSLGMFVVIGVAGVALWPFLIGKEVRLPFQRTGSVQFKTAEQVEQEEKDKMRALDTDGDTLNDYDEQYVFRTSPYLADSDSDAVNDGTEVAQETDPNCPRGKTCRQASVGASGAAAVPAPPVTGGTSQPATSGTTTGQTEEQRYMQVIAETFGDPNALTPEEIKEAISKMSASDLRSFLGKLGIPATALQRADDATLRSLVQQTLSEIAVAPPAEEGAAAGGQ